MPNPNQVAIKCALCALVPTLAHISHLGAAEVGDTIVIEAEDIEIAPSTLRGGVSLDESPRTMQKYDTDLFDQQLQTQRLPDIVGMAPNTVTDGSSDGRGWTFLVRGFSAPLLRDGLRLVEFGTDAATEMYAFESIEVLKGPDSIQFGESNPGGLVNQVVKRPQGINKTEAEIEIGSYGSIKPMFDHQGVFGEDDKFAYRVVTAYTYGESWREYDEETNRLYFAPSLRVNLSDTVKLTLMAEFSDEKGPADFGTVVENDGDLVGPLDQIPNSPEDTHDRDFTSIGYDIDWDINDEWTLTHRLRVIESNNVYSDLWLPSAYNEGTGLLTRVAANQSNKNEELVAQFIGTWEKDVGSMKNRLVTGLDYRQTETSNGGFFNPGLTDDLDWDNPTYPDAPDLSSFDNNYGSGVDATRYGIFAQNYLTVNEQWTVSAGLRFDMIEQQALDLDGNDNGDEQEDDHITPQLGAVYRHSDEWRFHANFSTSFAPSTSTDIDGDPLEPETGYGLEFGGAWTSESEQLTVSGALFYIVKENIAQDDPNDPSPFPAQIATGERTSQGIEVEVNGAIDDNWSIIAGIGLTDAEITDDSDDLEGRDMSHVPDMTVDLWLTYDIRAGDLEGLGFGLGLSHVGDREASDSDVYVMDAYTTFSAGAWYSWDQWRVNLKLDNVTDEEYLESSYGGTGRGNHTGTPFQALLNIGYTF